jgi:hypothetical protein
VSLNVLFGAIVLLVGLFFVAHFVWHPAELRPTSPPASSTMTFETKEPWAMAVLWGGGAVIGILIVVLATAVTLWWIFRRRLGWPRIVMIPIVLITTGAATAVAILIGAGAVHEEVVLHPERAALELGTRSLADIVRSSGGHREVILLAEIDRIEYRYRTMADADGAGGPEARLRLRLTTGRSVDVPTGGQPASAYDLASAIGKLAGLEVACYFQNYDSAQPLACVQLPARAEV